MWMNVACTMWGYVLYSLAIVDLEQTALIIDLWPYYHSCSIQLRVRAAQYAQSSVQTTLCAFRCPLGGPPLQAPITF